MVERKENRPQGLEGASAFLAEELRAVRLLPMTDEVDRAAALSFAEGCFHCFDETSAVVVSDDQAIEDDVERVRLMESRLSGLVQIDDLVVCFEPGKPTRQE